MCKGASKYALTAPIRRYELGILLRISEQTLPKAGSSTYRPPWHCVDFYVDQASCACTSDETLKVSEEVAALRLQGLFFYHTKKVGFVAGVKWGSGILITHILDERGRESWSAPVLFKIHEVSLGLLAGMHPFSFY